MRLTAAPPRNPRRPRMAVKIGHMAYLLNYERHRSEIHPAPDPRIEATALRDHWCEYGYPYRATGGDGEPLTHGDDLTWKWKLSFEPAPLGGRPVVRPFSRLKLFDIELAKILNHVV